MKTLEMLVDKISDYFERVVILIIQISVGALALDLILGVFFRYVLRIPIVGTHEIALFLLAWITFLGASLAIRYNSMVAITFLIEKMGRFYKPIQVIIQFLIFSFSILLLIYSSQWVLSPDVMNTKTPSLQISMWIPSSILPFSMLITSVFCINNIIKLLNSSNSNNSQETELL